MLDLDSRESDVTIANSDNEPSSKIDNKILPESSINATFESAISQTANSPLNSLTVTEVSKVNEALTIDDQDDIPPS